MDRYGYYGEVSYTGQNRFRPYSIAGLGNLRPVLSGDYAGAPGRVVLGNPRPSRANDMAVFRQMGMRFSGPAMGLGATDREMCNTLLSTSGALITAVGGAAVGARPSRNSGETQQAYERRLRDWETASRAASTAGAGVSTVSALCNLIDESENTVESGSSSSANEWELMAARAELARMYQQQGNSGGLNINTNTLLLVGGAVVAVGVAYVLLRK